MESIKLHCEESDVDTLTASFGGNEENIIIEVKDGFTTALFYLSHTDARVLVKFIDRVLPEED